MHIVCVTLRVDPAQWDAFLPLMRENADASLANEPGCHVFEISVDEGLCEVFLYEVYADAAAFAAHLETAHFIAFDRAAGPMILTKDVHQYSGLKEAAHG
ncbi:quinol monooxygenase YgiN [Rubricella aquisinus]|uniref:Quinol monooxygenase YgiN n=1 Tax=Rubricella aquisinus TaxID=2028108 RepID=A0A840WLT3_9RHOB|nr:putative quinol monooxygenase [Rubricella aquisinus]MBB5515093.1 quinol monooxygenase YgiN [Rubricella aquisinus]